MREEGGGGADNFSHLTAKGYLVKSIQRMKKRNTLAEFSLSHQAVHLKTPLMSSFFLGKVPLSLNQQDPSNFSQSHGFYCSSLHILIHSEYPFMNPVNPLNLLETTIVHPDYVTVH